MGRRETTKSKKQIRLSTKRRKRTPSHILAAAKRQRLEEAQTATVKSNPSSSMSHDELPTSSQHLNNTTMDEFIPKITSTPFANKRSTSHYVKKRNVPHYLMNWRLRMKKLKGTQLFFEVYTPSTDEFHIPEPSTSQECLTSNGNGLAIKDTHVNRKLKGTQLFSEVFRPSTDEFHIPEPSTSQERLTSNGNGLTINDTHVNREYTDLIIEPDGRPPKDDVNIISGRFIVDGKHLVQELRSLEYHRFECEKSNNGYMALVSSNTKCLEWTMKFTCPFCQQSKIINSEPPTSQPLHMKLADQTVWGFSAIGSGHRNMEEVLSTMNIAPFSEKTFKKTEERLGQVWQDILYESMRQAGIEERELAIKNGDVTLKNIPFITVVVDGGWFYRSHGHRYSANSGVVCVVGARTKKLLHIDVRNKYCSMCTYLEKKGLPTSHDRCYKNWDGASASMESDMIVQAFNSSEKIHGLQYRKMIGDGDSSVHQKIREKVAYGRFVQKVECANHVIKNYTKRLFKLRENGNAEKRILNLSIIKRLKAAVRGSLIHHCKEKNTEQLKEDLRNSLYHVLGDHSGCKSYFCKESGHGEELQGQTLIVAKKVVDALKPLILRASTLWENVTSNLAENYMSLVAKFTGGKQINRGKRGSFTFRTKAAALDFQFGPMWHYNTMKTAMKKSPSIVLKKTCISRLKRNLKCRKSLMKKREKKN